MLAGTDLVVVKDHIDINVDDIITYIILKGVTFLEFVWNRDRETSSWTPIKISRSRVRAADSDTSDDNISLDDCLSLNYQPVHGVPGFEIETADDTFWGLICSSHLGSCAVEVYSRASFTKMDKGGKIKVR